MSSIIIFMICAWILIKKGIGRGTALSFAKGGCKKIFLADTNKQGLEETKALIESSATNVKTEFKIVDISQEHCVSDLIKACTQAFSRVDYACNVAAIIPKRASIIDIDVAEYDAVININEIGVCPFHIREAQCC